MSEISPQIFSPAPISSCIAVASAALAPPFITASYTFFQTILQGHKVTPCSNPVSIARDTNRLAILLVFLSGFCIVTCFHWPPLVRQSWDHRGPLLSELLIVSPIMLSMLLTSIVLHVQQYAFALMSGSAVPFTRLKTVRWNRVFDRGKSVWATMRFRLQFVFAVFLLPALLLFLLRDLLQHQSSVVLLTSMAALAVLLVVFYPWLIKAIWFTRPVSCPDFQIRVGQLLRTNRFGVRDVRIVDTHDQYVLAMVIGLVPGTRTIFISDAMWDRFSEAEVVAVIHHELAHLKLNHFSRRLAWLLLPPVCILTSYLIAYSIFSVRVVRPELLTSAATLTVNELLLLGIAITGYVLYLYALVRPRIHAMEHEADVTSTSISDSQTAAIDLQKALVRMAGFCPTSIDKSSLLHPSLGERIDRLNFPKSANPKIQNA